MYRHLAAASAGLLCLTVTACSDPNGGRKPVSGKVTLAGQPLDKGVIFFEPLDGQGSQGNTAVAAGEYKLAGSQGLLPGRYRVRISAADGNTTVNEEEAGGPGGSANVTFADLVPPEWNVASTKEVAVKADGPNEFPFDIPNRGPAAKKKNAPAKK